MLTATHSRCLPLRPAASRPATHIIARARTVTVSVHASKGFGAPVDPKKLGLSQTCPCGSLKLYKECCQPLHEGKAVPSSVEETLRARFSAFVKGKEDFVVKTFAPSYLQFKYPELEGDKQAQLKRDVKTCCSLYEYSKLKILSTEQGANENEMFVEFSYESVKKGYERRTNSRNTRMKPPPMEKNLDGSVKVGVTVERSRFVREGPGAAWKFADYELKEFPDWLQEAKDAELKAKEAAKTA